MQKLEDTINMLKNYEDNYAERVEEILKRKNKAIDYFRKHKNCKKSDIRKIIVGKKLPEGTDYIKEME